jgi:hypothetical protein
VPGAGVVDVGVVELLTWPGGALGWPGDVVFGCPGVDCLWVCPGTAVLPRADWVPAATLGRVGVPEVGLEPVLVPGPIPVPVAGDRTVVGGALE